MSNNSIKKSKEKEIKLEVGEYYRIDGEVYLVDALTYLYAYVYRIDENGEPVGRARMIGSLKKRKVEKV
jgi:hypothetical protein